MKDAITVIILLVGAVAIAVVVGAGKNRENPACPACPATPTAMACPVPPPCPAQAERAPTLNPPMMVGEVKANNIGRYGLACWLKIQFEAPPEWGFATKTKADILVDVPNESEVACHAEYGDRLPIEYNAATREVVVNFRNKVKIRDQPQ